MVEALANAELSTGRLLPTILNFVVAQGISVYPELRHPPGAFSSFYPRISLSLSVVRLSNGRL